MIVKSNNFNKNKNFGLPDFLKIMSNKLVLDALIQDFPLRDAIKEYIMDQHMRNLSPKTIIYYKENLEPFAKFADKSVHDVTSREIKEYLSGVEAVFSRHAKYRALKAFFNWAVKNNYALGNPVNFPPPELPKRIKPTLSVEDVKVILKVFDDSYLGRRNRAIFLIFYDTGIRLEEMEKLTLDDINIEQGLLKIKGKGDKERIVSISQKTTRYLWDYLKKRGSERKELWLTEERRPLGYSGIQSIFRRLPVICHPHMMRHTFAIEMIRDDVDLFNLQTLLGHTSLEMVRRYASTLNQDDAIRAHKKHSPVDRL